MKKILFYAKSALKETKTIILFLSAFVGIIAIIDYSSIISSVCLRALIIIAVFILSYLAALLKAALTKKVDYVVGGGRKDVTIKFGDIFDVSKESTVVISVNEYFDTIIDGEIIALDSLHGQFVKRIFGGDTNSLDEAIDNDLKKQELHPIENVSRKKGKSGRYPIGTIARVDKDGITYFLLVLTRFSEKNVVIETTLDEYNLALSSLLVYINTYSKGSSVSLPLIGSARARLNKDKSIILNHILSTLRMSEIPLPVKLQIVLDKADRGKINLHDYK